MIECGTTIWLGKEKGMLKLDPNDPYDTQKDLMNNLLGAMLACMIQSLVGRKPKRMHHHRASSPAVSTLK